MPVSRVRPAQSDENDKDIKRARKVNENEHLFKLLIIGDSGVGKSALLYRFADKLFTDNYVTTIGVDFRIRTVHVNGERVKLQIWDTAGQERFRTITSTYYRGTHGVLVAYDVNSHTSFNSCTGWLREVTDHCENVPKILVGTKDEDISKKEVSTTEARKFADQNGMHFFETSAKENKGVEETFLDLTNQLVVINHGRHVELENSDTVVLGRQKRSKKSTRSDGNVLNKIGCC